MYSYATSRVHPKINVAVLASYALVNKSLKSLIENGGRKIAVSAIAADAGDLVRKVSETKPNIVLVCLMDNEKETIEVIPELIKASPDTRVIVLTKPNSSSNPTEVLQKGAMGVVGMNQSANVLIRAIEQVSQGETWLSQKLVSRLLNKDTDERKNKLPKGDALTKRELEVISMIGEGLKNKEISERMFISEATVRHHLSSIYGKLNVDDRLNLVIHAYRNGIVKVPERGH